MIDHRRSCGWTGPGPCVGCECAERLADPRARRLAGFLGHVAHYQKDRCVGDTGRPCICAQCDLNSLAITLKERSDTYDALAKDFEDSRAECERLRADASRWRAIRRDLVIEYTGTEGRLALREGHGFAAVDPVVPEQLVDRIARSHQETVSGDSPNG